MSEKEIEKRNKKIYARLLKGGSIGLLSGGFLGFMISAMFGAVPFAESYAFGLGDITDITTIISLYIIGVGAFLGLVTGLVAVGIKDSIEAETH